MNNNNSKDWRTLFGGIKVEDVDSSASQLLFILHLLTVTQMLSQLHTLPPLSGRLIPLPLLNPLPTHLLATTLMYRLSGTHLVSGVEVNRGL